MKKEGCCHLWLLAGAMAFLMVTGQSEALNSVSGLWETHYLSQEVFDDSTNQQSFGTTL